MEREPEQPPLAARVDEIADVQERGAAAPAVLEHLDHAALLDDVEPARLALGAGDEDRLGEAAREHPRLEGHALGALRGADEMQAVARATKAATASSRRIGAPR